MRRRTRMRHRLLATATIYAMVMMALAAALAWQVRTSHRELALVVQRNADETRALSELQQLLARLATEWTAANGELVFVPSVDAMQRMVVAAENAVEDSALPASIAPQVMSLTRRSHRIALEWETLDAPSQRRESTALVRLTTRLGRIIDLERNHRDQRLASSLDELQRRADRWTWMALAIVYIVAIVSFLIARRTLLRVVVPIERLGAAADRVARGELDTRVTVSGDQELAHLAERFNEMTSSLAESHQRLHDVANTDELTNLPNFRTFTRRLNEEIERAQRYEVVFGLLILDLDRFKKYNDTWGHQAGNEALVAVSHALRSTLRSVDIAARYGGEELAVIAPQTESVALAALAERIRAAIEAIPPIEGRTPLSVSIGGAVCPADGVSADALFKAADARLYQAKTEGRNRCVTDDGPRVVTRKRRPRA